MQSTSNKFNLVGQMEGTSIIYDLHFTHFDNKSNEVGLVYFHFNMESGGSVNAPTSR